MSATDVIRELKDSLRRTEKKFRAGCNNKASKICGLARMPWWKTLRSWAKTKFWNCRVFVLLDSNVLLAALARDGVCRRVLESSAAFLHTCRHSIPLRRGAWKLVTRFRRKQEQADELVSKLISVSLLRDDVAEIASRLRDPDDSPILEAAVAYHCEFLVTGDDDLLELKSFSDVKIVSVRDFAQRLKLKIDW